MQSMHAGCRCCRCLCSSEVFTAVLDCRLLITLHNFGCMLTQAHTHIGKPKVMDGDMNHQSLPLITGSSLQQSNFFLRVPFAHTCVCCNSSVCVLFSQLRYQKCLVARPLSQKACGSSPPGDSVSRRVSTSVKRGVLSLIDTLKQKRPVTELPQ